MTTEMEIRNKTLSTVDEGLKYIVLVELLLWAFLFLLIFVINWEGWIFGIRIAGLSAGLYFLARFLAAGGIACLILRYPGHATLLAALAFLFFFYLLLDSAVCTWALSGGKNTFPFQMGPFAVVPLVYLIIRLVADHSNKKVITD